MGVSVTERIKFLSVDIKEEKLDNLPNKGGTLSPKNNKYTRFSLLCMCRVTPSSIVNIFQRS